MLAPSVWTTPDFAMAGAPSVRATFAGARKIRQGAAKIQATDSLIEPIPIRSAMATATAQFEALTDRAFEGAASNFVKQAMAMDRGKLICSLLASDSRIVAG